MYDTVIFDYGNTLCKMGSLTDSLQDVYDSRNARQIGELIELYIRRLYVPDQISQPDWQGVWRLAFISHGEQFGTELGLRHLERFVSEGRLYPYAVPLLQALQAQGTKLVLLSNVTGNTDIFQRDLESKGLAQYFDRVIWSSEIGYRKPSFQAFQIALNSVGAHPGLTLMVGDNEVADMQGAKAMGMATMLVSDQHTMSQFADHIVVRSNITDEILRLTGPEEPSQAGIKKPGNDKRYPV